MRGFGEIKGFEFKKCFKASYGFYDAPRGRDFSYFWANFGINCEMVLCRVYDMFYVLFMTCFMSCLWHVLWPQLGGYCVRWTRVVSGQNGVY